MFSELLTRQLVVHELNHGLIALPFAYLIYLKTASFRRSLMVVLISYLVDLDHLFDYFISYGSSFSLGKFLSADYFSSGYSYILFHAWEWLVVFLLISFRKSWNSKVLLLAFALLPHLIYDSLSIQSIIKYSMIYRVVRGFYIP